MRLLRRAVVTCLLITGLLTAGPGGPGTAVGSAAGTGDPPSAQVAPRSLSAPTTLNLSGADTYALAPDGTFWTASGGTSNIWVRHFDDAGHELGDGFSLPGNWGLVKSMGYHGGRVFVMTGDTLRSWVAADGTEERHADLDTRFRLGGNQMILRVDAGGGGRVALGQTNKIGLLDLTNNTTEHPFYGQAWYGGGINTGFPANALEACILPATGPPGTGEPPENCGKQFGAHEVFSYAIDTAMAASLDGSVAVLSSGAGFNDPRVTILDRAHTLVAGSFGGFGSGNGQFSNPFSIVLNPADLHYFVSDQNNRRILEFDRNGAFLAGYGVGVGGGTAFESCGPGGPTCRAATAGPFYGQLDIRNGTLYAERGSTGVLDVFHVSSGGGGTPPPQAADQVRLKADKVKVLKGKKTKLTATVAPSTVCASRSVLFQVKDGRGWDNLGKAKPLRPDCTASRKSQKVTSKSQYRVVSINTANSATMATSPTVTLKPKPKKK
ncbi:hypothetical protein [Nocardioides halotolerans]|uniref:hypothetical protein n=1 Tax=Nocardioides halotolerans TaxID=433660 RepID=UPI000411333E|nr:hypothetical protein [Nocardioides halotolerans]